MVSPDRALAYERWANRRVLAHLQGLESTPGRALELFAHGLTAVRVWLLRLEGRHTSGIAIWPTCSLAECETLLDQVESAMSQYRSGFDPNSLTREVCYTNQHGLAYVTAVGDILFHVVSHGAYHRGQIALVLRQAGLPAVNTDYITFVREMAGQPWAP